MPVVFPPLHTASEEGLLAVGGILDTETLITAYTNGIFPWPISEETPLTWFAPDPRGIMEFKDLHIAKSFKRFLNQTDFKVKYNTRFEDVIKQCAITKRKNEKGTWISPDIIKGYIDLFNEGHAYSVEVYNKDDKLIGGLYGVCIGEIISGESMFHHETSASKFALYSLIIQLRTKGISWFDTQMVTPTIEAFGGKEISRNEFIKKLSDLSFEKSRKELFSID